jgi:hypothetical protein
MEEIQLPTERIIIPVNADDDDDSDYSDYEEIDEEESDDDVDDSMLPEVEYGGSIVVPDSKKLFEDRILILRKKR